MANFKDDIFRGAKPLPTSNDLIKVTRGRGISWRVIKGKKKEELSSILNIPLIFNPNYAEPRQPQRPSNFTLRILGPRDRCNYWAECCWYKRCRLTIVRDTTTGEEFYLHAMKYAYKALGTRDSEIIESWGFEVYHINANK